MWAIMGLGLLAGHYLLNLTWPVTGLLAMGMAIGYAVRCLEKKYQ